MSICGNRESGGCGSVHTVMMGVEEMRTEKRALSWQEFLKSGYQDSDYRYPDFEGTYAATLVCKRWGKRNCLFAYLDLEDGRNILATAWSDKGYLGLADMPIGSRITVTFVRASTGKTYLRSVEAASEGGDAVIS